MSTRRRAYSRNSVLPCRVAASPTRRRKRRRSRRNWADRSGWSSPRSTPAAAASAGEMLGHILVTKQTGPAGREVKRVYVEEGCDIKRELYLGMLIDRTTSRVTMMASTEGGMEIEEVAHTHPEKILKVAIDPATGMQGFHARQLAFGLGLAGKQVQSAVKFMLAMYKVFTQLDASIVEINPLVVTGDGQVIALDAKMNFDDNALFRLKEIEDMRDVSEEDPSETEAAKHGLNYIKLDGNIGCMVNGAGLAMATMDIIKLYGGDAANFLDVGGGATKERVTTAFKLILSDSNVEGTNVNLGKKILAESGLAILSADNLADAAEKIVKAVKEAA